MRWPLWLALVALLQFAGCAVQTAALQAERPRDLPARAELAATPFFPQTAYHCGPAALATALGAAGLPASPERLGERVFLPARQGTLQTEMLAGARREGAVATRLAPSLEGLLREVAAGHPVVVLQNLGLAIAPFWHYAVVIGYDLEASELLLRSGTTRREVMALRTFEHTWKRSGHWAFVALPPGEWPATAQREAVIEASVGFERTAVPEVAARVYRSALSRWPGDLSLTMGLGNTLHAAGDKAEAARVFRSAAEAHGSAPAWINLASTLLDLGDAAAALEAAQRAQAVGDAAWQVQVETVLRQAARAAESSGTNSGHTNPRQTNR